MQRLIRQCSIALLLLCVGFLAHGVERSPYGRYSGPRSLGPYSLDRQMSMKSLLAALNVKPSGKEIYCFEDIEHGLYLYAQKMDDRSGRVANVLISSFPNCKQLPVLAATIAPDVWKTREGIGVGSTKEDVHRAYGEPVFVAKLGQKSDVGVIAGVHEPGASHTTVGDYSYLYSCLLNAKEGCSDDVRVTRIGFSKDKVIWIHLSNSE